MPIFVNAAKTEVDLVKNNAAKTEADFVKVNAAKLIAYEKGGGLPPIQTTIEFLDWSQTYRGSGGVSGGTNRDRLSYAGDGWNNEQEIGCSGILNFAAVQAALTLRPHVTGAAMFVWVGHRFSGTGTVWVGFHGAGSEPATLPTRLHSEKAVNWGIPVTWTKPPSGLGEQLSAFMSQDHGQNIANNIINGAVRGMMVTNEDSNGIPDWGWFTGTHRSTSNTDGISGGITFINAGEIYAAHLVINHQVSP